MKKVLLSRESVLGLIAILLFIVFSFIAPRFLTEYNIMNMMFQLPEFGILAIAMMVVIVTGGIDLSITYVAALSGISMALLQSNGYGFFTTIIGGIVIALLCGFINGFVVSKIGVSPILVTLGTMALFEGVILSITKGNSISGFSEIYSYIGNGKLFGVIPLTIIIFVILAIVSAILLSRTKWGREVYMVGSNVNTSLFSGVRNDRVLMKVYLLASFLAFVAAIIMTSRYNSAKVDLGSSYLLQSVAAAVLGGTNIQGGYGKVIGTIYAVIIFQIISNALNLMGVSRSIVQVVFGVILISVLVLNFVQTKLTNQKREKELKASAIN